MFKNIPFTILISIPALATILLALYQTIYWSGAKSVDVPLDNIKVSAAKAFNPTDIRRAETTEIILKIQDDMGTEHSVKQLSPLTKYFFNYGDTLTVKYFNDDSFEATIWNFTIKFYYVLVVACYLAISLLFIGFAELKNRKRGAKKRRKYPS
jgi:hypothetical protein